MPNKFNSTPPFFGEQNVSSQTPHGRNLRIQGTKWDGEGAPTLSERRVSGPPGAAGPAAAVPAAADPPGPRHRQSPGPLDPHSPRRPGAAPRAPGLRGGTAPSPLPNTCLPRICATTPR